MKPWIALFAGAFVAALMGFLVPDFAGPISYGVGIFVGRVMVRWEVGDILRREVQRWRR